VAIRKKMKKKINFTSLKSPKKGVGSGVGSRSEYGSISQMYGYGDLDPHKNVTDPQHCREGTAGSFFRPRPYVIPYKFLVEV
jgi:hypothetical protein